MNKNKTFAKLLLVAIFSVNAFSFSLSDVSNITNSMKSGNLESTLVNVSGVLGFNVNSIINLAKNTINLGKLANLVNGQCNLNLGKLLPSPNICNGLGRGASLFSNGHIAGFNFGGGVLQCSAQLRPIQENISAGLTAYCQSLLNSLHRAFAPIYIDTNILNTTYGTLPASVPPYTSMTYDGYSRNPSYNGMSIKVPKIKYSNGSTFISLYSNNSRGPLSNNYLMSTYSSPFATKSYINDNQLTAQAYATWAQNHPKNSKTFRIAVPESYAMYVDQVNAAVIKNSKYVVNAFLFKVNLARWLTKIKARYPLGNTAASYSESQQKIYNDYMKSDIVNNIEKNPLYKNIDKIKKMAKIRMHYLIDQYKIKHHFIVLPSAYKISLQAPSNRYQYAAKMLNQEQQLIMFKTKFQQKTLAKINRLKEIAQKVYFAQLKYDPAIAQKQLQDILSSGSK